MGLRVHFTTTSCTPANASKAPSRRNNSNCETTRTGWVPTRFDEHTNCACFTPTASLPELSCCLSPPFSRSFALTSVLVHLTGRATPAHTSSPVPHPMPRTHFPNPANKDAMQELLDIQQTVRTLAEQLNRVERYVGAPPRGGRPTATLQAITIGGVQQPFFSGDQLGPLCFDNPDLEQQFFSQVHDRETGTAGGAARSRGTTAPLHPLTHALARPTPSQKQTTIIPHRNRLRRVLRSATCGSRRWSPCSTTMRWLALTLRRL